MSIVTAAERRVLLRVLVGSQAHGIARPDSDYDYREVFVIPTSEMLSLGRGPLKYAWQVDNKFTDDEGGHEVAQFLHLVSKGAPNCIEMLFAQIDPSWIADGTITDAIHRYTGAQLQEVGRMLLSRRPVQEGVIGYATNSWRKLDTNPGKWKAGMLRVLYQGQELLYSGTLEHGLAVPDYGWGTTVRRAAFGAMTDGEAMDLAQEIIAQIKAAPSALPDAPNWQRANEWLLALRKEEW